MSACYVDDAYACFILFYFFRDKKGGILILSAYKINCDTVSAKDEVFDSVYIIYIFCKIKSRFVWLQSLCTVFFLFLVCESVSYLTHFYIHKNIIHYWIDVSSFNRQEYEWRDSLIIYHIKINKFYFITCIFTYSCFVAIITNICVHLHGMIRSLPLARFGGSIFWFVKYLPLIFLCNQKKIEEKNVLFCKLEIIMGHITVTHSLTQQ